MDSIDLINMKTLEEFKDISFKLIEELKYKRKIKISHGKMLQALSVGYGCNNYKKFLQEIKQKKFDVVTSVFNPNWFYDYLGLIRSDELDAILNETLGNSIQSSDDTEPDDLMYLLGNDQSKSLQRRGDGSEDEGYYYTVTLFDLNLDVIEIEIFSDGTAHFDCSFNPITIDHSLASELELIFTAVDDVLYQLDNGIIDEPPRELFYM